MKLSLILEGIDRASRPVARVERATTGLGRASRRSALDVRHLDRGMDGASRSASRLERAGRRVGTGVVTGSRQGIRALAALDRRIQFSQAQMEKMAYRTGSFIGGTLRSGLMAGTAIGGAGLTAAIYKVVTAGLTFEKFRTQLEGLEGSAAAGERALSWVSDFAAKTPYELTEVMEAFIALKSYGIDPTNGTLRSLGDTAAGMGKSLMQAVEMIADAQTGEFERIKEFGIKASQQGDQVTFRWQRNGKELSKTVKQTSSDIQAALLGIMDQRFAGGMARMALTTQGKWSNLMDGLTRSANRVWEGGFGQAVNAQITRVNTALDKMEKDGSLKKWADSTGKGIGDLIDAIGSADWQQIARDIGDVGGAITELASALRMLDSARRAVADFQTGAEYYTGGGLLGGMENGRYVAPRWLRDMPKPAQTSPRRLPLSPLKPGTAHRAPLRQPTTQSPVLPGRVVPWPVSARTSALPRSAPPRSAPARTVPARPTAPAKPPKAEVKLSITTQPGTTAKPTKVAAAGMTVEVNTGRAMGAFA